MSVESPVTLDRPRIQELIRREEEQLNARTPKSGEMSNAPTACSAPRLVLPAPRSVADLPRARLRAEGLGRRRQCGTSTTASARWSRATPTPRSAARSPPRYRLGTHFAAPTEDAVVVAEELARRWGLPTWRYTNSGSEATMDAIRIARAYTTATPRARLRRRLAVAGW